MSKPKSLFILTVDTEEEWDWSGPFPNSNFSVRNADELPAFQNFCQELGVKPTYLVDYAIANDDNAAEILKSFDKSKCEIGAHLHPWANPPFHNETSESSSHVINLPIRYVKEKLDSLMAVIEEKIGVRAKSFRTGRWGINGDVMTLLKDVGIDTDSSVYPLYRNDYFSCENAIRQPYWPSFEDTNKAGQQQDVYEIPVTCGFNRSSTKLAQKFHSLMELRPFCWLRINGLFWHTFLLRKIYLSPELSSSSDMIRLTKTRLKKGQMVFHMYLHSSSLVQQVTGLNDEPNAREHLCQRIADVTKFLASKTDIEYCTLSEAKQRLTQQGSGREH